MTVIRLTLGVWLAFSALAFGQDNVPTTIYQQPWATLRTNTGISATTDQQFVPHGGVARDSAYPEIGMSAATKVVNNGTRNVLDVNTVWLNAGVVIDRIGSVAGGVKYPNYFDASGPLVIYADYHITTASINAAVFAPFWGFHLTAGGTRIIQISLSFYSSIYHIDLFAKRWTGGNINVDTTTVAKADLENKRIRLKGTLQAGTMDAPATTVQSDGSLIVSMIDLDSLVETTLYTYTSIPLWYTFAGQALGGGEVVPANNHMAVAALGYAGLVGENEQFVIQSNAVVPAEEPESSLDETSSLTCQGDAVEPGETATGEIGEAVSPNWAAVCGGGGEVPSAADLTDAEDWDQ